MWRTGAPLAVVVLVGCYNDLRYTTDSGTRDSTTREAAPDASYECSTFVSTLCVGSSGLITLDTPISTLPGGDCDGAPTLDYCIIAAGSITVKGYVRVTGTRPLVLLATQTIDIGSGAVLDASGSGVDPADAGPSGQLSCGSFNPGPSDGGPGGSFATSGGNGGAASGGSASSTGSLQPATTLLGGCPGGTPGGTAGGVGGTAGGAVLLHAAGSIDFAGSVLADGGGGGAAAGIPALATGGGGGGTGGLLVLEAPSITGGGSGTGSTPSAGMDGSAGGLGGAGRDGNNGGAGGVGGTGVTADGTPGGSGSVAGNGGGGGGGGAGYVYTTTSLPFSVLAEPPALAEQ